jgi:ribosomal protein L11 methylase PrmA
MVLNGVANAISLSGTAIEDRGEDRFSLVCANLILGELLRLMPDFSRLVDAGGHLIVSGILRDQVERIECRPAGNGVVHRSHALRRGMGLHGLKERR